MSRYLADIIIDAIKLDLTDNTTAAALSAAYPDKFPTAADVPEYLFTNTKTLLLGAGASDQSFFDRLSRIDGDADVPPDAGIYVSEATAESIVMDGSSELDESGGEYAIIKIICRIDPPDIGTAAETRMLSGAIQNLDLRIRWLVHHGIRSKRGLPPHLPINGSSTADREFGFALSYLKQGKGAHALEMASLYKAEFVRVFV